MTTRHKESKSPGLSVASPGPSSATPGLARRWRLPEGKSLPWIGLIALGALAVGLRMIRLGQECVWIDEIYGYNAVRNRHGVIYFVLHAESNPPLYFIFLKAWSRAFGRSYYALRVYSAVVGGLCAPLFWICARRWRLGLLSATVAALILALHPMQYWHSQQNRYYATLYFMSIWWLAELPSVLDPARPARFRWQFVVSGFLAFVTHYYFAFLAMAAGMGALAWWARARGRGNGPRLGRVLLHFFALGATMLAMAPMAYYQMKHNPSPLKWAAPPTWRDLVLVFDRMYWSGPSVRPKMFQHVLPVILEAAAIGGFVGAFWGRRRGEGSAAAQAPWPPAVVGLFLAWTCLASVMMTFVFSLVVAPLFLADRYTLVFLPPFILALASGWALWPRRWGQVVTTAAMIAFAIVAGASLKAYWKELQFFDWKTASDLVARQWLPGDVLAFDPHWRQDEYHANGGHAENIVESTDMAAMSRAGRAWLFSSEMAGRGEGLEAMAFVRQHAHSVVFKRGGVILYCIDLHPTPSPPAKLAITPAIKPATKP